MNNLDIETFDDVRILVVIVTYNAIKWIDRCLNSLADSTLHADAFIVDNGSQDGTQSHIKARFQNVIFKQSDTNLGFGRANNIGMKYALEKGYDYVYLLNQDAWVFPDTFEKLVRQNLKCPVYGILSPFQIQANLKNLDFVFGKYVCSYSSNEHILSDLYLGKVEDIYEVPDVMAAHWLISRACLEKVGGFSPSFPHYGEDNNYAQRLRYHGFKIGIVPAARGVHDREHRVPTIEHKMYMDCFINMIVSMSNPDHGPTKKQLFVFIKRCLKYTICHFKLAPAKYIFQLMLHRRMIAENREISKGKAAAFLD